MQRDGVCQCGPMAGITLRCVALGAAAPEVSERMGTPVERHIPVRGRKAPSVTKGGSLQEVSFRPVPSVCARFPSKKWGNTYGEQHRG